MERKRRPLSLSPPEVLTPGARRLISSSTSPARRGRDPGGTRAHRTRGSSTAPVASSNSLRDHGKISSCLDNEPGSEQQPFQPPASTAGSDTSPSPVHPAQVTCRCSPPPGPRG